MQRTVVIRKWFVIPVVLVVLLAQLSSLALAQNPNPVVDKNAAAYANGLSAAFRQATDFVQPTVVSITSEKEFRISGGSGGELPQIPEDFRRFFGDDFERCFQRPSPESRGVQRGFGSGVIVSRDGYVMDSSSQLRNTVAATVPGTAIELEVFRDGRTSTMKVKLGLLDDSVAAASLPAGSAVATELGVTVRTLTPELASQLGIDADQQGVVITDVEPDGLAARGGLRPRDIIVSINGDRRLTKRSERTISSVESACRSSPKASGGSCLSELGDTSVVVHGIAI